MFLKWEPIYSVNIKEIDNHHQKIFSIVNDVYGTLNREISKEKRMGIIKELQDYGDYHLDTEEKYFKKFDYPGRERHIAEHNNYREKIAELAAKCDNCSKIDPVKELADFLRNWWLNHIQSVDHEYSDFFNKKGLF